MTENVNANFYQCTPNNLPVVIRHFIVYKLGDIIVAEVMLDLLGGQQFPKQERVDRLDTQYMHRT